MTTPEIVTTVAVVGLVVGFIAEAIKYYHNR